MYRLARQLEFCINT